MQNMSVDDNGVVTRSAVVSTDELLTEYKTAQSQADNAQTKADALAELLVQVAIAPQLDPAILAKINAVPVLQAQISQVQIAPAQ